LEVWPVIVHVWQLFAAVLPEAPQAIEHIISAFTRAHVSWTLRDLSTTKVALPALEVRYDTTHRHGAAKV
jgi:hypothetical protein